MARPIRLEFSGARYHVTSRGDSREAIYLSDDDRLDWLSVLEQVAPFAEHMPFSEDLWRHPKQIAAPKGIHGHICALPLHWTLAENNHPGMNMIVLTQTDPTRASGNAMQVADSNGNQYVHCLQCAQKHAIRPLQHRNIPGRQVPRLSLLPEARRAGMQLRRLLPAFAALALSALFARPCFAWEYEDAVPLPRPDGQTAKGVSLEGISISLRGLSVTIENSIHNKTGKPFKSNYAIYLPPFAWSGAAAENAEQYFPELKIESSQGPISVARNVVALSNGRQITDALKSAKIDPLLVARRDDAVLDSSTLRTRTTKDLVPAGVFDEVGGQLLPRWHALVSYNWSQSIPPQQTSLIRISYRARPEFGSVAYSSPQLAALVNQHCATMGQLDDTFKAQGRATPSAVVFQRIEIPFGLAREGVTKATFKSEMNSTVIGLMPAATLACSGNEDRPTLVGKPSLDSSTIESPQRRISILVIYPQ